MKRALVTALVLMALLAFTAVFAGLEDDRFKGGSADGYANIRFLQTSTDWGLIFARYKGGSYDGYAKGEALLEPMPPPLALGTIFLVR